MLVDSTVTAPVQTRRISSVTSVSSNINSTNSVDTTGNMWDLNNLQFIDDSAWSFNSDFWMNAVGVEATSSHPLNGPLLSPGYPNDEYSSNRQDAPRPTRSPIILDLRSLWITKIHSGEETLDLPPSSPVQTPSSGPEDATHIDEQYRRGLTNAFIYQLPQDVSVPSSEFLVC